VNLAAPLSAQAGTWNGVPAATLAPRFQEVWNMGPGDLSAAVKDLVLRRDQAEITLREGRLYLLQPVGGQVMGAVFRGHGTFHYVPASPIERNRLTVFHKDGALEDSFDELVLLFADSTVAELGRQLHFEPGKAPDDIGARVKDLLKYFGDEGHQALDPDLFRPFLNGEQTGLFVAEYGTSTPWIFLLDPQEIEGVQVLTEARHVRGGHNTEGAAQERRLGEAGSQVAERRPEGRIDNYQLEVTLTRTGSGDVGFLARAKLALVADTAVGPWVPFSLFANLEVDSARWDDGTPAEVAKHKDSGVLWVRCDRRLAAGDSRVLQLVYHGDVLDRVGDWAFLKSSTGWYPQSLDYTALAKFDLTFLTPEGLTLATVGEQSDSATAPNHMIRTHWVTATPIRNASFNLGRFDRFDVGEQGVPPVTVLWSESMHKLIAQGTDALMGKNMKQQVGTDVAAAMQFYQKLYGPLAVKHFYATEIPDLHGEAFPGLVHLSWITFHQTSDDGFEEVFRAHEVAHQWWGIGVDYPTYHDQWMSEGFATFSGLWFLQTRRNDAEKYFGLLKRWRDDILRRRDDALPIWLGYRVVTSEGEGNEFNTIIYEKGAWVLHMLRILLLDLKSMNEDRFTTLLHDFFQTYQGKRASTEDFRHFLEERLGQDLGWFFNQWVYGTAIPTYRILGRTEEANGAYVVKLTVIQEKVPADFLAYVPVSVELGKNQVARFRVKVTGASSEITLPPLPAKPQKVIFNDLSGVLADTKDIQW
jgi:hypothetical protein